MRIFQGRPSVYSLFMGGQERKDLGEQVGPDGLVQFPGAGRVGGLVVLGHGQRVVGHDVAGPRLGKIIEMGDEGVLAAAVGDIGRFEMLLDEEDEPLGFLDDLRSRRGRRVRFDAQDGLEHLLERGALQDTVVDGLHLWIAHQEIEVLGEVRDRRVQAAVGNGDSCVDIERSGF